MLNLGMQASVLYSDVGLSELYLFFFDLWKGKRDCIQNLSAYNS